MGKLVSTKKNYNNIHVETDDINDNIVKVLKDNAEYGDEIRLNIH